MSWDVIVAYGFGIILLVVLLRLLYAPAKFAGQVAFSILLGLGFIGIFDWIGGFFGLYLPFNPITAAVAGFLGVPGVALLVALQWLVVG